MPLPVGAAAESYSCPAAWVSDPGARAVLRWAGLGWTGLGWARLDWAGLGWAGLCSRAVVSSQQRDDSDGARSTLSWHAARLASHSGGDEGGDLLSVCFENRSQTKAFSRDLWFRGAMR